MNPQTLAQIANLSQLDITGQEEKMMQAIEDIFNLINELSSQDTTNIQPLNFPLDILQEYHQPIRCDKAEVYDIEKHMKINAPLSEDNFYLVPKVIE